MATERLDIVVSERGSRTVKRDIASIGTTAKQTGSAVAALRQAFIVAGLGLGIAQLIELADAYTTLRNRVRLAVGPTGDLTGTLNRLFGIANDTRQPVEAITTLFQRGSIAARELGASQEELITFTTLVGQGLAIQGGSAEAATGALLQLSQALGSGIVRAEEFNSVLEGAFPIAQAAAQGLDRAGGSVARLRQLITSGQVTSQQFFDALLSQAPELAAKFATTVPTIGNTFTVLRNNVVRAFGEFNLATGASQAFAQFILLIANNAGTLIDILEAVAYAMGVKFAVQGVGMAITGLRALAVAVASNPLGAIATIVLAAGAAFVAFSDKISLTQGSSASAFDFIATAFGDLVGLIGSGVQTVIGWFSGFQGTLQNFDFLDFVRACARGVDMVIGLFYGLSDGVVQLFRTFPRVIGDLMISGLNRALRAGTDLVNGIIGALNRIPGVAIRTINAPAFTNPFEGAAAAVGEAAQRGFQRGLDQGVAQNYVNDLAARAEERARQNAAAAAAAANAPTTPTTPNTPTATGQTRADLLRQFDRELENQNDLLRENARERDVLAQIQSLNNQLTDAGFHALSDGESRVRSQELRNLAREQELLKQREDILLQVNGDTETWAIRQEALNQLMAQGTITQAAYNQELREMNIARLEAQVNSGNGSFADGFLLELNRMLSGVERFRAAAGQSFGKFFSTLADGFANSVGRAVVYSENLGAALQEVARSALAELIGALVKLGIQWLLNATLGQSLAAATTASSAAMAAATAAAWAPAATAVSLASFGANSPAAITGMAAAYAAGATFAAIPGFKEGGYTGDAGTRQMAGIVHGREFVVNAEGTRRNRGLLEAINSGQAVGASNINLEIGVNVSGNAGENPKRTGQQIARELEQHLVPILVKHQRPGGVLARPVGGS